MRWRWQRGQLRRRPQDNKSEMHYYILYVQSTYIRISGELMLNPTNIGVQKYDYLPIYEMTIA